MHFPIFRRASRSRTLVARSALIAATTLALGMTLDRPYRRQCPTQAGHADPGAGRDRQPLGVELELDRRGVPAAGPLWL